MVALPDPIIEGDLDRAPFAHVLAHVATRQITGSVVLWPAEGEARTGQDRIRVEQGHIVAGKLVERAAVLEKGLVPLLARQAGPYAVYEEIDLVGDTGQAQRIDTLAFLASGLRLASRDDAVERMLAQVADRPLRLKGGVDLKRFAFLPKEERFVDVMRGGPATVAQLLRGCELGDELGKRIVYLLVVTKTLEPYDAPAAASPRTSLVGAAPTGDAQRKPPASATTPADAAHLPVPPSMAPPAPATASASASSSGQHRAPTGTARFKEAPPLPPDPPSTGLSPDQLAFWREVIERTRAIDTQTFFQMLNVPREAGTDTIRKEYFALAKRWHPDRISGALAPIKPFVERIFGLMTQAQDTLTDENKRGPYLRSVQDGGGTPEADRKLGAIVAAAMEHQKAEVLIRRRDFEGARQILEGAIDLNPEEADALASLAWTLFHIPGSKPSQMLDAADRALKIVPKHDRAHYARAMVL
ncbi:MAG TPA: J domain-containing protein, partial [Polyangiaceae bacterium]|nr:J domain-containing protein [Polyangiaceae bacterium]